jgi:CDP-glucose 4,6-dehydratase
LVAEIFKHWPGEARDLTPSNPPHEAGKLNLALDKAYHVLGWQPIWTLEETVEHTVHWYRQFYTSVRGNARAVRDLTQKQIHTYTEGLGYTLSD